MKRLIPKPGPESRKLEEQGWYLRAAVQRIFSGEREPEPLTAELDDNSALIVRYILELL